MAIRDIFYLKFNSPVVRGVLRRFYRDGDVCRVRFGPLKGSRLVYHRSVNFHAILGLWDLDVFAFLENAILDRGLTGERMVVADVGANIGFYSLWFARRAQQVHAFEPAPEPRGMLAENLALNDARNVVVVNSACGDKVGSVDFFVAPHHHSSSLHESWANGDAGGAQKTTVPVTTLDRYFGETQRAWPDLIKMDIEGGGTCALPGAERCLREKRPLVLIESHTPDEDAAISRVLTTHDYNAYRFNNREWVRDRAATHPNREGVWGTMLLCPSEKKDNVVRAAAGGR